MRNILLIISMVFLMVSLLCGCGGNKSNPTVTANAEYSQKANLPSQQKSNSSSSDQQKTPELFSASAQTDKETGEPKTESILPAPAPFPDDGKVPGWKQSNQFPDYAYNNPNLPQQLYKYSLNQQKADRYSISIIKPVDFYYETTAAERARMITFFKKFIAAYYTTNYRQADKRQLLLCGYLDPKSPVTLVNNTTPAIFIIDDIKNIKNNKLNTSVTQILTDESLIYLDSSAYYRIRGRITLQVKSSTDKTLPAGTNTLDVETAFKEKLLSGPENWAAADYIVTSITTLR